MTNNMGLEMGVALLIVGMPAMAGLGRKLETWTTRRVTIAVLACVASVTLVAILGVLQPRVAAVFVIPCFHLIANKAFRVAWRGAFGLDLPSLPSRMSDRFAFALLLLVLTWPPIFGLAWLDRLGLLDSPRLLPFPA